MDVRNCVRDDLPALMEIFDEARGTIAALGIDQWQNGYPDASVIGWDIDRHRSYCVTLDSKVCGTFALIDDGEPTYDKIFDGHWKSGDENQNYIAIHRVAVALSSRGCGISTKIIDFAANYARRLGRRSIRIDTHRGNAVMRRMLEKHGFEYCGIIYLASGDERVAYEKMI